MEKGSVVALGVAGLTGAIVGEKWFNSKKSGAMLATASTLLGTSSSSTTMIAAGAILGAGASCFSRRNGR